MNDGMYNGLSAEARETNSLLKQVLGELQRMNEALSKLGTTTASNAVVTVPPATNKRRS